MRYDTTDNGQDNKSVFAHSTSKRSNVLKRLVLMLLLTISLVAASAGSASSVKAGSQCELVCGEPFTGNDGQCYVMCCPQGKECMNKCELRPCK